MWALIAQTAEAEATLLKSGRMKGGTRVPAPLQTSEPQMTSEGEEEPGSQTEPRLQTQSPIWTMSTISSQSSGGPSRGGGDVSHSSAWLAEGEGITRGAWIGPQLKNPLNSHSRYASVASAGRKFLSLVGTYVPGEH